MAHGSFRGAAGRGLWNRSPVLPVRTLLTLGKRRRLRYRTRNDDILATSRFTIPVSLIVPLDADVDDAPHRVRHLLQLRYPELELIVVVSAGPRWKISSMRCRSRQLKSSIASHSPVLQCAACIEATPMPA